MNRRLGMVAFGACLVALVPAPGLAGEPSGGSTLEDSLRQSGWEVRRVEGEGLRLYPPQGKVRPPVEAAPAPTGGGAGAANEGKVRPPVEAAPAPAGAGAGVANQGRVSPPVEAAPVAPMPPGLDLEALRRTGWRIERAADGSTLIYPPGSGRAVSQASAAGGPDASVGPPAAVAPVLPPVVVASAPEAIIPTPGFVTAPVREEAIKLPVNRWGDARSIADAWVAERGGGRFRVGKIRQIHRVYLVSIVGVDAPSQVIHQIAITAGNGHVLVLN